MHAYRALPDTHVVPIEQAGATARRWRGGVITHRLDQSENAHVEHACVHICVCRWPPINPNWKGQGMHEKAFMPCMRGETFKSTQFGGSTMYIVRVSEGRSCLERVSIIR